MVSRSTYELRHQNTMFTILPITKMDRVSQHEFVQHRCNIYIALIYLLQIHQHYQSPNTCFHHVFDAGDLLQEASTSSCARGTSIRRQGHVDNGCALEKTRCMFSRTVHQIDGRCTRSFYWWSFLASIFARNVHIKRGTGSFFRIPLLYFFVA